MMQTSTRRFLHIVQPMHPSRMSVCACRIVSHVIQPTACHSGLSTHHSKQGPTWDTRHLVRKPRPSCFVRGTCSPSVPDTMQAAVCTAVHAEQRSTSVIGLSRDVACSSTLCTSVYGTKCKKSGCIHHSVLCSHPPPRALLRLSAQRGFLPHGTSVQQMGRRYVYLARVFYMFSTYKSTRMIHSYAMCKIKSYYTKVCPTKASSGPMSLTACGFRALEKY